MTFTWRSQSGLPETVQSPGISPSIMDSIPTSSSPLRQKMVVVVGAKGGVQQKQGRPQSFSVKSFRAASLVRTGRWEGWKHCFDFDFDLLVYWKYSYRSIHTMEFFF